MAIEEKRQFDAAKQESGNDNKPEPKSNRPSPSDNALSVMNHEAFRKK